MREKVIKKFKDLLKSGAYVEAEKLASTIEESYVDELYEYLYVIAIFEYPEHLYKLNMQDTMSKRPEVLRNVLQTVLHETYVKKHMETLLKHTKDIYFGDNLKIFLKNIHPASDSVIRALLKSEVISIDRLIKACIDYKELTVLVRFIVNNDKVQERVTDNYLGECASVFGFVLINTIVEKIIDLKSNKISTKVRKEKLRDLYALSRKAEFDKFL